MSFGYMSPQPPKPSESIEGQCLNFESTWYNLYPIFQYIRFISLYGAKFINDNAFHVYIFFSSVYFMDLLIIAC